MALILNSPTQYPPRQWRVRQEIDRLAKALGIDMEREVVPLPWEAPDSEARISWWELSDSALNGVLEVMKTDRLRAQQDAYLQSKAVKPAPVAVTPSRAVILQFLVSEETIAAIQRRNAESAKKDATRARSRKADSAAAKEKAHSALRKQLMVKVQVAKKQMMRTLPEFSDQTYRFILEMKFGASSSKDLTAQQLHELLLHFQELGWQQKAKGKTGAKFVDHPMLYHDPTGLGREGQMRKIQALLLEKNQETGQSFTFAYALGILKRQTSGVVSCFEDASPVHLRNVIAALARNAVQKREHAR